MLMLLYEINGRQTQIIYYFSLKIAHLFKFLFELVFLLNKKNGLFIMRHC